MPEGIHAFDRPKDGEGIDEEENVEGVERIDGFEPTGESDTFRAAGTRWDGATGESENGRSLRRGPAKRLFAFEWQDDHGSESFPSVTKHGSGHQDRD